MNIFNDCLDKKSTPETIYWQKELESIAPFFDFPTDRVRSNVCNLEEQAIYQIRAKQNLFVLDRDLSQALAETARQENVSLSILLLAAFQVLLYRYTNQQDIVVGCLHWDGYCPKTKLDILPIRVEIKNKQNFTELLNLVKTKTYESIDHSEIKSAALATALKSENPDFHADSLSQMLFRFCSLSLTSKVELTKTIPKHELFLDAIEKSQHLIFKLEYDCHLFDESTIQRIVDNYQVLLQSIVTIPQTSVKSLSLLSSAERQQVLFDQNQTQAESTPQCIYQLFETRADKNPEALAIICGGEQLTYGELNQQANQLAHYLQAHGVTPGSLVGLCIERSLAMVVGVLAILKAGAAYVPLDISNPPARLAFILEDAEVKALVTQSDLLDKLPAEIEQTVCVDRDRKAIAESASDNLNLDIAITDLAHIVYTSGSTGKPKGVMLTHGNLSHYAQSLQLALDITPEDVYLHRGSIALIVSARQLLMPLAQGATAVIVTKEETKDPLELFALIKRHGVTIVDHVPSFWRNFWGILNQLDKDKRDALLDNQVRLVAAGGEQVTPEIYQCWRETFKSDVRLANIYGQTEGTGVVTLYQIPDRIDQHFKSLPVGRPISNMRVYLLDSDLQPVPIGVAAEIHISGAGVAQGYLNRPELTAEKFVANPYVAGERIYKTGDLGRLLPNGSIQFLGRVDRQVNIQGLRIELGEIEAVLSQHELVVEAAIIVRENKLGETLCAYIVPSSTHQPTVETLRSYLATKLPAYMIPSTFLYVDEFPLTTSGKVDYQAIAVLEIEESTSFVAPGDREAHPKDNRTEAEIVEILESILGIKSIGGEDNFIELGGNSLIAARLVTEIENRYAEKIPISKVFQASTPKAFASLIRSRQQVSLPKSCIPIKLGNSQPIIFAIHNLGYGLEFYRPLAEYLDKDVSIYGLSSSFSDDPDAPHLRDIKALASYYVRELLQFQPQGAYYLMGVSFGGVVAYEMAQILMAQGYKVNFLGLLDSYCPDGNSVFQISALKERIAYHFDNFKTKGLAHVIDKIKRRWTIAKDELRCNLYSMEWIRKYLIDDTSREFARAKHKKSRREHDKVNKDYVMSPYVGDITLFRATKDSDPKLNWQKFALANLTIIDIPGEHLEILQEPIVQILAREIQLALSKCFETEI